MGTAGAGRVEVSTRPQTPPLGRRHTAPVMLQSESLVRLSGRRRPNHPKTGAEAPADSPMAATPYFPYFTPCQNKAALRQ